MAVGPEPLGWAPWLVAVLGFILARGWYCGQGIGFWSDTVYFFSQILDPPLLRDHLLQSLWHLHAQPPIFNALTGLVMKGAPQAFPQVFQALFLGVGLATMAFTTLTLREIAVPRWPAVAIALVFCCAPPFVLYENWYFYPHLSMGFLAGAAWCLARSGGRPGPFMQAAFWVMAALVLLRSLFHPVYLVLALAVALVNCPRGMRKRLLLGAVLPLVLVGLFCAKNLVVLGFFGTSSWGGNSLHRVAKENVPRSEVSRLVETGVLAPISPEWEFSHPRIYMDLLGLDDQDRGVPALDRPDRTPLHESTKRDPINYNHWVYLDVSRLYMEGALELIRRYPGPYLDTVGHNLVRFLDPVTRDNFVVPNRNRINVLATRIENLERAVLIPVVIPVLLTWSLASLFRPGRRRPRERLVLLFALGTIGWVTVLGSLAETGENSRFRYQIMGLVLLVSCHGGRQLAQDLRTLCKAAREKRG